MGQRKSCIKESSAPSSDKIDVPGIEWIEVRAIIIYGVPKSNTKMQWQFIESVDLEDSDSPIDARAALHAIIQNRPYDDTYYAFSLYYHLSTDSIPCVIHDDIISHLNSSLLQPTRSLPDASKASFLYCRLLQQKRDKLF